MKRLLSKIFGTSPPIRIVDSDFGTICYDEPGELQTWGYWQMESHWRGGDVSSACIPGDENGPWERERKFILSKFSNQDKVWQICESAVFEQASRFVDDLTLQLVRSRMRLTTINTNPRETDHSEWEAGFDGPTENPSIYVLITLSGVEILHTTVDT
ncbi:MAG: hypothetical protein AAGD22_04530 [Verrucomicrobiota bacterium]